MDFRPINPENMPPELREAYEAEVKRRDLAYMEAQANAHRMQAFVYGLKLDDLLALSTLLQQMGNRSGILYWSGIVDGLMQDRHNVCGVHGVNHEDAVNLQAALMMDDELATLDLPDKEESPTPSALTEEELAKLYGPPTEPPRAHPIMLAGDAMNEYNVVSHPSQWPVVYCLGCSYKYPSLEDRMLKAPGDCPGCQMKASQG